MCFSAPVSFAASGIIGATGIATLKEVKHKYEIPFASIPLIFSIHQFMEGLIWLSHEGGILSIIAAYFYLVVAVSLWPVFTPIAVYLLEDKKNKLRKKILATLIIIGALVGIISLIATLLSPVSVSVVCNSIYYGMGLHTVPWYLTRLLQLFYVTAGLGCMFVSSHKFIRFFGAMMTISFLITYIFHYQVYFSVWCFFAALLSLSIYYFFKTRN